MEDEGLKDILKRVREQSRIADLTTREVLDILWLANTFGPALAPVPTPPLPTPPPEPAKPAPPTTPATIPPPTQPAQPPSPDVQKKPGPKEAKVFPAADGPSSDVKSGISTLPLRAPGTAALLGSFRVARALRPLMRRVPSRTVKVMDEVATAERIAELDLYEPVRKPALTRWLNLALVIDRGGSMRVWSTAVRELRAVFERHRAFRTVRSWNIADELQDGRQMLTVRHWTKQGRAVRPRELVDPSGRQLVVIVTDCVSNAWSDGRMAQLIAQWSTHGPVGLLQMLPEKLWTRTALRYAESATLRATAPGVPNAALLAATGEPPDPSDEEDDLPKTVKVPVAALVIDQLQSWANLIAARGGASTKGYLLRTEVPLAEIERLAERRSTVRNSSAAERKEFFDGIASYEARRLARIFAAAPFPLVPPVMRLLQRTVLPKSDSSAIAEVLLLGGIMRRVEDSGDDPERTRYEFADDEVRELMLNDAGHADSVDVITTNVSHFLGEHFGEVIDFAALIENPTSLGGLKIAPEQKPFARIGASVLRRLGGGYREVGMAIESALDQTTPGPPVNGTLAHTEPEQEPNRFRDWSGKNHPRRTRVELAAYLGDHEARKLVSQKVPKDFQEWVTGLRRWGVPVMLHGALVAARRVLRDLPGRDSRRRMAMITAAERCLSIRRREAAVNLQSHVFAEEDNTNSAVFAAQAVAYAFSSVGPIGARTEELVLGTIAAALREHRSETDLRNAIRDSLMENLLRDVSVVPDRVPEREIILVASTLIGDLSEVVQSTAYQLGERLARDGYKLMASNNLTISGYTYAAEMLGIDVESRLTEYSTKSSWWQRLWKTGPAAAIVIGDELDVFDASDDILIIGLPWTRIRPAEQPAALAYPWQNLLNEHGIATSEDVALMVDRLLAALDVAFSLAAAEVLREYLDRSDTIRATTPPSSEALDACFEFLDKRMPEHRFLAQLLVRDAFADDDHAPVFASIARQYALSTALAWLTFYIRDAARLRPTRSNRNLPTIIETLINKHPASWVEAVSGLSWDELLFRCSLPLSMFEAAERYLALERDFGPSGMPQTGRWDLDYVADRLEFIDPYARSGNEAERIVGYWLLRKDDLKIAATDLARYLAQEIARGPVTRRSPASQLLETIWRTLPRYGRSERRIIARVVSAAEVVTRDIDSQFIITSLLQERLTDAVDEIRAIDSFAQPLDGSDRMSLPVELTSFELTADELRTFLEINTAGYRMLARRLATHVVGPPALDLIASAFETASLGYDGETLAAIDATNEVASRLTASQLARLAHAINANRHLIPDPNVSARLTQLGNRLNQLRERSERLRNSTVAVIGSDPENVTQPFCRTLGALLAANDIDLVCANPTIASILIEGYRSIKADLDGAIVLRSEWDMRPMREDLPYQTIRGDLREVRQEMLARATIIIAVGGENGTRYEYRNARQLKIPVIPVASYGGATLSLYREAISDLSNLGVAAASLTPLISERNPERLAEVALVAVMEANLGLQRRSAARVEANRRAAILDTAALVAAARSVASESELVEPATIPDVMKALREGLDVDLSHARMLERRARRLLNNFHEDPYIAELASRAIYTALLIDAAFVSYGVEKAAESVRAAAAFERFSPDSLKALVTLRERLEELTRPGWKRRDSFLDRLSTQIARHG